MGACMDTTTTREGTQNVLEGQCSLAVCRVFQLLCMIFDLGFHRIALGKYTSSSMQFAFNMLFWCSDALCKGGVVQVTATKLSNVRLWMSVYGRRLRRQGSLVRTLARPTPTIAPAQHQPTRCRTTGGTGMVAPTLPRCDSHNKPALGRPYC